MKIVSFNANGVRARIHQIKFIVDKYRPDIIGLQEIKVADDQFPVRAITELGYHALYFGQKGHYGVALLSLLTPKRVIKGFPTDDKEAQKRLIAADFQTPEGKIIRIINGYFPQGDSRSNSIKFSAKSKFYQDLYIFLKTQYVPEENLIIIGDFNVSATDNDIGIGSNNKKRWLRIGKCSFLPEERNWFTTLLSWGLVDCFRELYPSEKNQFSWFDYRSRGFEQEPKKGLRIDGILATHSLFRTCSSVKIDYEARSMEKPSDHAPVVAEFAS
ncbi:MAG: exodeoxyribonuclease III [Endozoicomonas sp. (ex Botrylloides leachii)]|nr:exodeoxyribonuclease III [Endozoicomonas sp. (ex Botrylloides leachii)]